MRTANRWWWLGVLVVCVMAAGCKKDDTVGDALSTYAAGEAEADPEYVVEQPDSIRIEVVGHPDVSRGAQLRPDGKITMPLLGDVAVTGLTSLEIDEKLSKLYERYLKDVDITVTVTSFASKSVYVFREPGRTTMIPYTGNQDFLRIMAQAGGPGSDSILTKVLFVRPSAEKPVIRELSVEKVFKEGLLDEEHNPTILAGDIIYIPMDPISKFTFWVNKFMQPVNAAFQPIRTLDTWDDVVNDD